MTRRPSVAPTSWAWLPGLRALRRRRSVILGYHGVGECPLRHDLSRLQVSPRAFRRQIEVLAAAGFEFRTMAQAVDDLADGRPRPGIAVVTFDDGLRNNFTTALPILRELGVPATVYVTCDLIGGVSPWVSREHGGEMLHETEIRTLARAGWEIGAHTLTHPDLAELDYERCVAEIEGSRRRLTELLGGPIETFAYPFGRYGPEAVAAVRDCGLRAAVTTGSGTWRRFELTRAMISNGDPDPVVALKLTDRYEPLLASPPLRAARAGSRQVRSAWRKVQRWPG